MNPLWIAINQKKTHENPRKSGFWKSLDIYTGWGPQESVNRCLVSGWNLWFMVDVAIVNGGYNGLYKPTYNWGGPILYDFSITKHEIREMMWVCFFRHSNVYKTKSTGNIMGTNRLLMVISHNYRWSLCFDDLPSANGDCSWLCGCV